MSTAVVGVFVSIVMLLLVMELVNIIVFAWYIVVILFPLMFMLLFWMMLLLVLLLLLVVLPVCNWFCCLKIGDVDLFWWFDSAESSWKEELRKLWRTLRRFGFFCVFLLKGATVDIFANPIKSCDVLLFAKSTVATCRSFFFSSFC